MNRKQMRGRLFLLAQPLRAAFAAACAGRVVPYYSRDCGRGDAALRNGVDLAWRFAEGAGIGPAEFNQVEAAVKDATPNMEREPEHLVSTWAGLAVLHALETIKDPTANSAMSAANAAMDCVTNHRAGDTLEPAEEAWQARAFEFLESWGSQPPRRDMFAGV